MQVKLQIVSVGNRIILVAAVLRTNWNPIRGTIRLPRWPQWLRTCLPMQADLRDANSIPGSGRSPGGGHGNPCPYSCLEYSMDRGAWQAAVHRVAQSRTRLKRLHAHVCTHVEPSQWDPLTFPESQFDLKSVPVNRTCVLYICSTRKQESCSSCEFLHI